MRRIIQRYQDGGVVEFGPYMSGQTPQDFQPGSQQQNTDSTAGSNGNNIMNMQEFVDSNSAIDGINPNLYPSVGPLGVNPMVSTGIPEGGYAKQAVADYLAGKTLGGPLSYVAGESNVPDYRALADELGTSVIDKYRSEAATSGDNNTANEEMMNASSGEVSGEIETLGGGSIRYDSPSEKAHAETIANVILEGGINEDTGQPNISAGPNVLSSSDVGFFGLGDSYTDQFQENYDAQSIHAANNPYGMSTGTPLSQQGFDDNLLTGLANNSLIGKAGEYITGNTMLPDSSYLLPPESEAKKGGVLSGLNLTGPVDPNLTLHRGGRYDTSPGHSTDNDSIAKDEASRGAFGTQIWSPALGRHLNPSQVANRRANGLPVNNGGYIGPLVKGYNNGGVSLAKSGLREEEIQERQRMQARLPQVQQSALPGIGSKLALGAIDKGIGSAASALAGQQGLAGTLGTALGGTAGAAGTGMMAALGPIGIGLGLGKLFGVFNKGGKVTCSCGKPNCNCSSKMKYSPLGGSYD